MRENGNGDEQVLKPDPRLRTTCYAAPPTYEMIPVGDLTLEQLQGAVLYLSEELRNAYKEKEQLRALEVQYIRAGSRANQIQRDADPAFDRVAELQRREMDELHRLRMQELAQIRSDFSHYKEQFPQPRRRWWWPF